jgi:trehalose/maltose hydrolase-like predicted phosphorylase
VASDGGIHIAALGGVWLTAVFGFAGLSLTPDGPALDPRLPPDWTSLGFRFQWRGRSIKIRIDQTDRCIDAVLETGEPMALFIVRKQYKLIAGQTVRVSIQP